MKKLFIIDDTLSNKVSYYHIILFLIFLPFDRFYSQLVLVSFAIHTLLHLKKMPWGQLFNKEFLVLAGVFLLSVICIIYTTNKSEGYSLVSRQLAMLLIPLILLVNPLKLEYYRERFFWTFTLTCLFTVLYLYLDALRVIFFYHLPVSSITSVSFINHNFSLPIGLHATYLSMYITLALLFLVTVYYKTILPRQKTMIVVGIVILFAGLLQLGSRAVLIADAIIGLTIIPFLLQERKQRGSYFAMMAIGVCILTILLSSSESLRNRYIYQLETDLGADARETSATTPRIERWKLGFELVKASPIIGYGSGDETELLTEQYFVHRFYNAFLFRLNSHNQYLAFLIKSGIIGLLIYLSILVYAFRIALKRKDILFLGFLVVIATVSFSENYLDVNKGIFFYAFFLSFFIISTKVREFGSS